MIAYILYPGNDNNRVLSYLLFPFYASSHRSGLSFCRREDELWKQIRKHGKAPVIVTGKNSSLKYGALISLLRELKEQGIRTGFFDASPNPVAISKQIIRLVDIYFKQSLFVDYNRYRQGSSQGSAWLDWYTTFNAGQGATHPRKQLAIDDTDLAKLRLSWNTGYGLYPRTAMAKRLPPYIEPLFGPRPIRYMMMGGLRSVRGKNKKRQVHARMRLGTPGSSIHIHRQYFMGRLKSAHPIATTRVSRAEYNREICRAAAIFSPFGVGEVCYRDFEAALHGAALVKPDMSHLVTRPNVYDKEAYFSVNWAGDNIGETIENALHGYKEASYFSHERLKQSYLDMDAVVDDVLEQIAAGHPQ